MKLNEKQRETCLEFALRRYLKKWQGTPEIAYRRLMDYFALVREGIEPLNKSAMEVRELGVMPRGCYTSLFAFDLVVFRSQKMSQKLLTYLRSHL